MNRGLIVKGIREVWPTTLLFGLALAGFEVVLVCVFPSFLAESAGAILQIEFVRNILRGLLGSEIGRTFDAGVIPAFAWVHPLVLALLWAHEITICSKMLAGEIDRGTIDVLLGLPVSRTQVYVCVTVVALGAGLCVVLIGLAGNLIGGWFAEAELRSAPGSLAAIVANLYCLYIAVAGAALMISSVSDHRGRAVGITLAFVLASFFLSFLSQFWNPAKTMALVSVLTYYRPLLIVESSAWPIGNMVVLVSVGAAFWLVGAIVFARRDICTV